MSFEHFLWIHALNLKSTESRDDNLTFFFSFLIHIANLHTLLQFDQTSNYLIVPIVNFLFYTASLCSLPAEDKPRNVVWLQIMTASPTLMLFKVFKRSLTCRPSKKNTWLINIGFEERVWHWLNCFSKKYYNWMQKYARHVNDPKGKVPKSICIDNIYIKTH